MGRYDKIINYQYSGSTKHPKMSMHDRAAQFSPFAALTGYEKVISETARLTDKKIELDDNQKEELDRKLQFILQHLPSSPICTFIYFVKDEKKQGGKYIEQISEVSKINFTTRQIALKNGTIIPIDDILEIKSEFF